MSKITFSLVAHVFYNYMIDPSKTRIVQKLLSVITECKNCDILNKNNSKYTFDSKECIKFFNGEANIYNIIKEAALKPEIINNAEDGIYTIIEELIGDEYHEKICEEIRDLVINDTTIPKNKLDEFQKIYDENETNKYIAYVYLYSLSNNNKTKLEVKSIQEKLDDLIKLANTFSKPEQLLPPEEVAVEEFNYIDQLLKVFAEDANVQSINKDELTSNPEYKGYKTQFNRHRKDYYSAEAIRESVRDIKLINETDYFEELENETFDGIIDLAEQKYDSGMKKMQTVLSHATKINLNSILARIPNWINNSERKGLCHELVNDKKIWWIDE